jgi:cruciform cutting endonuclease 1
MSQHSLESLQRLSAISLRSLLTSIGSKKTGNKPQLVKRLHRDLSTPKIPSTKDSASVPRILSIDMGIQNLAYCLTSFTSSKSATEEQSHSSKPTVKILAWSRINVLQENAPSTDTIENTESPFSPKSLAPVAYKLVNSVFLPLKPSVILIERQRFRSGGASPVQEWTLRVNMLEAMLWAILCTIRHTQSIEDAPEVHAVGPMAVAAYWLPEARVVKKKEKVDFVKTWLNAGKQNENLEVEFTEELQAIKEGFINGKAKVEMPRTERGRQVSKLDDLADCFLQAAAWASWETNRRSLNAQHDLAEQGS